MLFHALLDSDSGRRAALLAEAELEVRREVESLLEQPSGTSPLDHPAWQGAKELLEPPAWHCAPGQQIGPYKIEAAIGAGGMGEVFRAIDTRLKRPVAVKVIDPRFAARLAREAHAISSLNHPHICTLYDVGPGYLVMELIEGETLAGRLKRGPLSLKLAVEYGFQITDALAAAHDCGLIHRDLKPGNIMICKSGIKILDFGLAKSAEDETMTGSRMVLGTPAYLAPEQAAGERCDTRTDIYALGLVLAEMLTGKRGGLDGTPPQLASIIERCLAAKPAERWQSAGDLAGFLKVVTIAPQNAAPAPKIRGRKRWAFGAAVCGIFLLALGWTGGSRFSPSEPPAAPWVMTRLTSDTGLSTSPVLSRDGKLVAYSSDAAADGQLDLYIRQVEGSQPIRLTSDGAGNTSPDFSPDGTKIVFRSERDAGGIYEIPAFGGEPRLLAPGRGQGPKYSPDGSRVVYWVGTDDVSVEIPGSGSIWIVPAAGGPSRRIGANFTGARHPIWSPDGKYLLVIGYASEKPYQDSSLDWWLLSSDTGRAVKTGAYPAMNQAGLEVGRFTIGTSAGGPVPSCWEAGNQIIFSASSSNTLRVTNLWEMPISPDTGKASGRIRAVTVANSDNLTDAACNSLGGLAFTKQDSRRSISLLGIDLDRGAPKGPPKRIKEGPGWIEGAAFSKNGRYLAFASDQSGPLNVWRRDLEGGRETDVASFAPRLRYPAIDASGNQIAFSSYEARRAIYLSSSGGVPQKLCEDCLQATSWSQDGRSLLVFGGNPYQINLLDISTHRQIPLLKHPSYHLLYGEFSPDNRWISFTARIEPNRSRLVIAPLDGEKPVPESAWIVIGEGEATDSVHWSSGGNIVYFSSPRDGRRCLWGQRLDTVTHRPVGDAFPVQHFHGREAYGGGFGGFSVAGARIAFALEETRGNIWMMSRSRPR